MEEDWYKVWYASDPCGSAGTSFTIWVLPPGETYPWLWRDGWDAVGQGRAWSVKRRPRANELARWQAFNKEVAPRRLKETLVPQFLAAREDNGPCLGCPVDQGGSP